MVKFDTGTYMHKISFDWKAVDSVFKNDILNDVGLLEFWRNYFASREEALEFVKTCLKKLSTRRMMLRVKSYVDISDNMPLVKKGRPALQVIFLMALAEGVATLKMTKFESIKLGSLGTIRSFFRCLLAEDKIRLEARFKRALTTFRYHKLGINSIVGIFYQARNDAVHGYGYWEFFLEYNSNRDADLLVMGYVGTRRRRRRVPLVVKMTYEELRDIFVRTAIENIRLKFN